MVVDMATADELLRNFDRWMDVQLDSEAQKTGNFTGCNPNEAPAGTFRGILEDTFAEEIIPYEKLKDVIAQKDADGTWLSELIQWILNQKQEGSCVPNALVGCHQVLQTIEVGADRTTQLSAISIYDWIARSAGSGSNLDDSLEQVSTVGVLPLDTEANRAKYGECVHPATGFRGKYPSVWKPTAALFKGLESYDITSPEGLWTAICKNWPVQLARDGHCIYGARLFWKSNSVVTGYVNSWGQWGDIVNALLRFGMGYDSERATRGYARGAIAYRQVKTPEVIAA